MRRVEQAVETDAWRTELSTQIRPNDETQPKCSTHESEVLRTVFVCADVTNCSLSHSQVAAGKTIERTCRK